MKYLILLFSLLTIINGDVRRLLQTNTVCPTGEKLNPNGECRQICGGIAVLTCPNGYRCADDPTDTCNPKDNDADCSGFCESVCPTGEILDPNGVCMTICGTIAGITCPNGYTCIDDPRDTCDPKNNGVDCSGFCHETPTCTDGTTTCTCDKSTCEPCNRLDGTGKGICSCRCDNTGACLGITKTCPQCTSSSECRTGYICDAGECVETVCPTGEKLDPNGVCMTICGTIAGITCPNGYTCIDDPRDTCDPKNNGVDCSGFCHETPTCTVGTACNGCDRSQCNACSFGGYDCKCECDANDECATVTTACPTDPCENVQCSSPQVCKNGACVTPPNGCTVGTISPCNTCDYTSNCKPCYRTDQSAYGVCECECDDAGACLEVTRKCPVCALSSECRTGYICDGGSCVFDAPACTDTCDNNSCDITSCKTCSDGTVVGTCECQCLNNVCVGRPSNALACLPECTVHTDCTNGYCNSAGECQTDCTVDKPCENGYTCKIERGKCMPDTTICTETSCHCDMSGCGKCSDNSRDCECKCVNNECITADRTCPTTDPCGGRCADDEKCDPDSGECVSDPVDTCAREGQSCLGCSMGLLCGQCKDGSEYGWCGACTCDNTLTCQPKTVDCACKIDDDCDGCCNADTGSCDTEVQCVGLADPCSNTECLAGEKCVSNYCGSCSAKCVSDPCGGNCADGKCNETTGECISDDCDETDCDICPNGGKVCNNKYHGCVKRECPACLTDALRPTCKDDDPPSDQGSITFNTKINVCKIDNRFSSWRSIVYFIKKAEQVVIRKISDNECVVEINNFFTRNYKLIPLTDKGTEFVDNGQIIDTTTTTGLTSCSSNDDCEDDEDCRSKDCYIGGTTSAGLACEGYCIKKSGFDCSETCYDDDGTFIPHFKIETEIVVSCDAIYDDALAEAYKGLVNMGQQLDVDLVENCLAESISDDWKCKGDGLSVVEIASAELTLTDSSGNVIDSQIYNGSGAVEYSILSVMVVILVIFSWM